jgi:xanthine dehydrogenase accessory factor
MGKFADILVLIKGAGDLGSGVAARLHRCGFPVVMTELPEPLMVRRSVSFGEAIYEGGVSIEGIEAKAVSSAMEARAVAQAGIIPILVDPETACRQELHPIVLVDAIMAKHNTGTTLSDAPLVVGLGPGFTAGLDCHVVIETNRGHSLGRVLWQGSAEPDTQVPGAVGGRRQERVLRAPANGVLQGIARIGDLVTAGQPVATVNGTTMQAGCAGVLRGLARPGLWVTAGLKVGDVDPRADPAYCFSFSDKSQAIGGGVLEAILVGLP